MISSYSSKNRKHDNNNNTNKTDKDNRYTNDKNLVVVTTTRTIIPNIQSGTQNVQESQQKPQCTNLLSSNEMFM